MDHKEATVQFLNSTGLIPVELNPGDKSPINGLSLVDIGRHDKTPVIDKFYRTKDANIGAVFSGKYVDVDVDSMDHNLMAALDKMLPDTKLVWGRPGKRRSHRVYQLDEDLDRSVYSRQLNIIKNKAAVGDEVYSVEIRGGSSQQGFYTVLPGSFIRMTPDKALEKGYMKEGEQIEWEVGSDPSVSPGIVNINLLIKRIRMAQCVAILTPHWLAGRRNDMSLSVAGMWWRISNLTTSILEAGGGDPEEAQDFMIITREDCEEMMGMICDLSGDDPSDRRSRLLNLKNTWRKLDKDGDSKATGGKTLAQQIGPGGDKIVGVMYSLLSDSPNMLEVEKWVDKIVLHYARGRLFDLDMVKRGETEPWMSRTEAKDTFGREYLELNGNKIDLVNFLYTSKMIRYVHGLTFNPADTNIITEMNELPYVNQWRGFDVKPYEGEVTVEYMQPFINYVYNMLASGDQNLGDWIMSWIAHIFQRPADKSKTALVLVGEQGAGKTFLGEHIIAPLIGGFHAVALQNVEDITGRFNSMLDNKLFVMANEAVHQQRFVSAQMLKTYITDDKITIEPKNVNRYEKPNHTRFLFTSNSESAAVFIEPSPAERRFTVVKVSSKMTGESNKPWWKTQVEWFKNNRSRVMKFLMDYKLDMDLIRNPYYTTAKAKLQINSTNTEVNWWIRRLIDNHPLSKEGQSYWWQAFDSKVLTKKDKDENVLNRTSWPDKFAWDALEEDFREYCRRWAKPNYHANARYSLKELLPYEPPFSHQSEVSYRTADGTLHKRKIRLYTMPTKSEIIAHLEKKYGKHLMTEIMKGVVSDEEAEGKESVEEAKKEKF